jgi:hypothetical protein
MDQRSARLAFWGVLALMRCVGSSPAAAASALRNRLAGDADELAEAVFDEQADEADATDLEPAPGLDPAAETRIDPALAALADQADRLAASADPKLQALITLLKKPLADGANPVVFCRYIATASHVAAGLRRAYPNIRIDSVTGELPPEERRARVDALGQAEEGADPPQRILVATDCLSEGVNLQVLFDMVVHYDLSWNPTRHQQREGRVDRYGQPSSRVRSVLMFSPDSAIDGAVLEVILRKAELIRTSTGVVVPLPDERGAVSGALMNRVLLRRGERRQLTLDLGTAADAAKMEVIWTDAAEGEKRSRTRFAQNAIRPADVTPEWYRWRNVLSGPDEVRRFVSQSLATHNAAMQVRPDGTADVDLTRLPDNLRERLQGRGLSGNVRLTFASAAAGAMTVTRNHPLVATLSDGLLEAALDPTAGGVSPIGRAGAWISPAVQRLTTLVLLRLRLKLIVQARAGRLLLAEESQAVALSGDTIVAMGDEARALLDTDASADLAPVAQTRMLTQARDRIAAALSGPISAFAAERAGALAEDHDRVRTADGRRAVGAG